MMYAFCWATGVISFGEIVPEGAIFIAFGPLKKVRALIWGTARLAYDGHTFLVPGIPEADDQIEARNALSAYLKWIGQRPIHNVIINLELS